MSEMKIEIPINEIELFCRRNRIRRLALFGSVVHGDFRQDSDVDMLVQFEQGHAAGLLRMASLELELSEIIGRKVDLRTPAELSRHFRNEVMKNSVVQYEHG